MKTLKLAIATSLLSVSMSVHAGFLDGIKKIGGGVAEAVGGAVDATVNVTTSAVQSVSVSSSTAHEVKSEARKQDSTSTTPAVEKIDSPIAQENASYAKDRDDLERRLQSFRFREDFQSIESVSEKNRIANRVNVAKSNLRRLPHKAEGDVSQQLRTMLEEEAEIVAAVKEILNKESEARKAREKAAAEARELAAKQQAEREVREKAEAEARELAAKQQAEREAREKAEREAREKAAAEARELAAKQQAEREAREKAEREVREKADAEARELAAKQQAEREAREKAEREVREKAETEALELAAQRQSEKGKGTVVDAATTETRESGGTASETSTENCESKVSLVEWKTLFITLGIWLLIVGIGCAVAFFSKKPSADEIPQRLHKCYFISKLDYVPAMLTVPTLLVLLIGFGRSDVGEIWGKVLLFICGCGLLAMNWWALLKANATWTQALGLLPMRIVVGVMGLILPVFSALMALVSIGLAAQGGKSISDAMASSRRKGWTSVADAEQMQKGRHDIAAGAAAGALGAAGGWASKKMWGSITSRTRSLVGWETED